MLYILQEPAVRRLVNSAESPVRVGHGPFFLDCVVECEELDEAFGYSADLRCLFLLGGSSVLTDHNCLIEVKSTSCTAFTIQHHFSFR